MRKNSIKTKSRQVIALTISIMMAVVFMPTIAFAAEGDETNVEELKAAMAAAEADMNTAKDEMESAEANKNTAYNTWQEKKQVLGNAEQEAREATAAATEAINARDQEVQNIKSEAAENLTNAQAALTEAEEAYQNAVTAVQAKTEALQQAEAQKAALEREIEALNGEITTATGQVTSLQGEVTTAQADVDTATTQWEQDKQAAAEAVEDAQTEMDAAGRGFIDQRINDNNGSDLATIIAACKTYTSARFTSVTDSDGNTYSTVADVANSANFETVINRGCTYENLKKNIGYIREANVHRNLPIHNAGDLKISYQLMGTAIVSNAISVYQTGHNLINGDTDWNFWKSGNSMTSSENLAYSGASREMGWDPFHGWYYKERMRALSNERGHTNVSQTTVNEVLQESVTNGFPYDPYSYPWYQTQEKFRNGISSVTGHYTSLIDSKYKATGFSYIDSPDYCLTGYPYVAAQEFNGDTSKSVTVDAYEQDLENWFSPYKTNLENAQAAQEALESKPEAVTSAEATLQEKQTALTNAQQTVTDKTTVKNQKSAELTAKNSEIETLTEEKNAAEEAKEAAAQTKTGAGGRVSQAQAAKDKADAIDLAVPGTYEDYLDRLELLLEAVINANASLSEKETAVADARSEAKTAEDEYNDKVAEYDSKVSAYNSAKSTYDLAKSAYDEAKSAYDKASDLTNATLTVSNATYTGKALTPKPKVVINGKTLTQNTDYTVAYENNTNAGKATVTVTGAGDYIGSTSGTFTINKATNTLTTSGKKVTLKAKKLKKKNQTVKKAKAYKVTGNVGKVTFKKGGLNKKKFNKKFIVNAQTGNITVKKGVKKGTYKLKVIAEAAGNANYNKLAKTMTVTIKIK